MKTLYESLLDNIDDQAEAFEGHILLTAWIQKCIAASYTKFDDIEIKNLNKSVKITHSLARWGFLEDCIIDDTFKSLPQMEFEHNNRVFHRANVTEEVDPEMIFDKCPAAACIDQWDFYGCSVDYITELFDVLSHHKNERDIPGGIINIYNAKENCDFSKLARIQTPDFRPRINKVIARGKDIMIPSAIMRNFSSIDAKNLTIDLDLDQYCPPFKGDCMHITLHDSAIDHINFINIPSNYNVMLSVTNCRISNLAEIMGQSVPHGEIGISISADAASKKRSGISTKVIQIDILGNEIKQGDVVLYPHFYSSRFGGNSSLKAAASRVIKVTDSMIETSGKRVYGKFCLIVPEKNDITQAHGNNIDMYGREINVGDIIAYCGSENRGNTSASVMLGEVEKIKTTIMVKNAGRRLYGADVYRVDKQWLKENDKSHKYKDLY